MCSLLSLLAPELSLAQLTPEHAHHAKPCVEQTNDALDMLAETLPQSYARWSMLQRYQALDSIDTVRRLPWGQLDHHVLLRESHAAFIRKADDATQARHYAAIAKQMHAAKDYHGETEARSASHFYWTLFKIDALGASYLSCLSQPGSQSDHEEHHKTDTRLPAEHSSTTPSNHSP